MSRIETVSVERRVAHGRLADWVEALAASVGRVPVTGLDHELTGCMLPSAQAFSGQIEWGTLGSTVLAKVGTTVPHRLSIVPRTPEGTATDPVLPDAPVVLLFQTSGSCHLEQGGASCRLYPGDWSLVDVGAAFDERFFGARNGQLVLRLDRPHDADLLQLVQRATGQRFENVGLAHILFGTLEQTLQELAALRNRSEADLQRVLTVLAWSAIREQIEAPATPMPEERLRHRIKAYIEAQLAAPDLSIEQIARACATSVRSIHRAFADDPAGSVSRYLWLRRLRRCAATLRDGEQADRAITDICLSWGFNSTTHFSRLFKEEFGVTPREFRAGFSAGRIVERPSPDTAFGRPARLAEIEDSARRDAA